MCGQASVELRESLRHMLLLFDVHREECDDREQSNRNAQPNQHPLPFAHASILRLQPGRNRVSGEMEVRP